MSTYQSQQGALHCSQFQNNLVYIQSGTHDTTSHAATQVKEVSTGLSCQTEKACKIGQASDFFGHLNSKNVVDDSNDHSSNSDDVFRMQA